MIIQIDTDTAPVTLVQAIIAHLQGVSHTLTLEPSEELIPEDAVPESPPAKSIFDKPVEKNPEETKVDMHGVIFDPEYCALAKTPFFTSGSRKGQWKKRVGLSEQDYDAWYASRLPEEEVDEDDDRMLQAPIDSSAAFGAKPAAPVEQGIAPEDAGKWFHWLAQKQAMGSLKAEDISSAYSEANLEVNHLFPPYQSDEIRQRIALLYNKLVGKAGV